MNQKKVVQGVTAVYRRIDKYRGCKAYKESVPMSWIEHEKEMLMAVAPLEVAVPVLSFGNREIVMLHADDNLYTFLKKNEMRPDFFEIAACVLYQVQSLCVRLALRGIVHGDLTLFNLVVFYGYPDDCFPRVREIDFGKGSYFNTNENDRVEKTMICSFLRKQAVRSGSLLYDVYRETFNRKYFRKPFKDDFEYDWLFFMHHLFIAFPQLHPASGLFSFFSLSSISALHRYLTAYAEDCWY